MRRPLLVLLLGVACLGTGCLSFHSRVPIHKEDGVSVFLRSDTNLIGRTKAKGYSHPVTISNIRLTHMLANLDLRTSVGDGNKRRPVVPTELLAPIASGLALSLSKADPDQEVIVMALRNDHTFGIFDKDYLTSLVVFARDDRLFFFVDRSDDPIEVRQRDRHPEPRVDVRHSRFRLYAGTGMTLVDSQTVAMEWRSPQFSRPTRTRILPSGEVVRKTILLEEAPDVSSPESTNPGLPAGLSPTQLRALADLEEERQRGAITEGQYQTRRAVILSGS